MTTTAIKTTSSTTSVSNKQSGEESPKKVNFLPLKNKQQVLIVYYHL